MFLSRGSGEVTLMENKARTEAQPNHSRGLLSIHCYRAFANTPSFYAVNS